MTKDTKNKHTYKVKEFDNETWYDSVTRYLEYIKRQNIDTFAKFLSSQLWINPIHALFLIHILDISKHYLGFKHTINADAIEQYEWFIFNHILKKLMHYKTITEGSDFLVNNTEQRKHMKFKEIQTYNFNDNNKNKLKTDFLVILCLLHVCDLGYSNCFV